MAGCFLHADLDNFYASVEMMYDPTLRGVPIAVCGDPDMRHGIVLAKNQLAKARGVKTGQALWEARQICPGIRMVTARMERYLHYARRVRAMYGEYTDFVEPYGLDECWLDLSKVSATLAEGVELADTLRARVANEFGLSLSVGVGDNRIYAKLGSDLNKPNGTTLIGPTERESLLFPLPVEHLLFVGPATKKKLNSIGIFTIGQLASTEECLLVSLFGKVGIQLREYANGRESDMILSSSDENDIKSIGNSITTGRDLVTPEDAQIVFYGLADCVSQRLRVHDFHCRTLRIFLRDSTLATWTRQVKLPKPTAISGEMARHAMALLAKEWQQGQKIRMLGLVGCDLCARRDAYQLDFFGDEEKRAKEMALDQTMDGIRRRFGYQAVQRGILLADPALGPISPHRVCALPTRQ